MIDSRSMATTPFKVCPTCSEKWDMVEALLADPLVELIGYQVNLNVLEDGLFYFLHHRESCGTTMAIPVAAFKKLSDLPFLAPRAAAAPEGCEGLCLKRGELGACPQKCECNWVREIMQTIHKWKKSTA